MTPQGVDLSTLFDALYDASLDTFGVPVSTGIFARMRLIPLSELAQMVRSETGEILPPERLDGIVELGWIPDLKLADGGQPGFAMYEPSRVGLFLELERKGYDASELRSLAEYEEGFIDAILVNEEMPYIEDDREMLLANWRTRVEEARRELDWHRDEGRSPSERERELLEEMEQVRRSILFLERRPLESMSVDLRKQTARMAFHVRAGDEYVRVMMLEHERAVIRMGYTPYLQFEGVQHFGGTEPPVTGPPKWDISLRQPWAWEEGVSIRVPGLRLVAGEVISKLRPTEYEKRWRVADLDGYFRVRAEIMGQRSCLFCHRSLPSGAPADRRYCSDTCRSNAKMQRYRDGLRAAQRTDRP
jgi:hypothetical protein